MKSKFVVASLLLSALFAGPAGAQGTHTPRIDQAQQAIGARIQAGLASGHITPSEAQMLIRRDRDIQLRENQFKANGSATPQERQQLRAELSALATDVERQTVDGGDVGLVQRCPFLRNQIDDGDGAVDGDGQPARPRCRIV